MTRPDQKATERWTLDHLLSVAGIAPDSIEPGEAPDFMLSVCGKKIGVEVTMYQSGTTDEAGIGRRQVESEWEILEQATRKFQALRADLRNINVGLMFRSAVPARKQHQAFMAEIAAFIRVHAHELTTRDAEFWPPQFSSPLMAQYLRTLYLRVDEYAVWHSNIVAGWVGRPDSTLTEIVVAKSSKKFRPADELWLAIQSSPRISETVLPLEGVTDFAALSDLSDALKNGPFTRLYMLAFNGVYQWDRTGGWENLSPPRTGGKGPTFDELKAVLDDPEWLGDPMGKAERVAKQVLDELHPKDQS